MDAARFERLKDALCYCLPVELAREHLQVMRAGASMSDSAAIIICEELYAFVESGGQVLEDYQAGRINEYRAIQGLVKHIASRLKTANLVIPVKVEQVPPWRHTAARKHGGAGVRGRNAGRFPRH